MEFFERNLNNRSWQTGSSDFVLCSPSCRAVRMIELAGLFFLFSLCRCQVQCGQEEDWDVLHDAHLQLQDELSLVLK